MKVLLEMSGGVDSTVSAIVLQEEGYTVIGATMKLLESSKTDMMINDTKILCNKLGITHKVFDFTKGFQKEVIDNFIQEYKNGKTPNPCVICNRLFKFGLCYQKALELGCEYIATGHYGDIQNNCLISLNNSKDQSYFLYKIDKRVLPKVIFPLKKFKNKNEVREFAKYHNLPVFNKKDSQEICFIENNDYISFLKDKMKTKKGNIVDLKGNILGKHDGLYKYTIGQRKGLGISSNQPLYVNDINIEKNELILGTNDDLYKSGLIAKDINLLVKEIPLRCLGKTRSRGVCTPCTVEIKNDKMKVIFDEKVRAITRGQSIVLYKNNICLGGGIIEKVID